MVKIHFFECKSVIAQHSRALVRHFLSYVQFVFTWCKENDTKIPTLWTVRCSKSIFLVGGTGRERERERERERDEGKVGVRKNNSHWNSHSSCRAVNPAKIKLLVKLKWLSCRYLKRKSEKKLPRRSLWSGWLIVSLEWSSPMWFIGCRPNGQNIEGNRQCAP